MRILSTLKSIIVALVLSIISGAILYFIDDMSCQIISFVLLICIAYFKGFSAGSRTKKDK